MKEQEIKRSKGKLFIPLVLGLAMIVAGLIWYNGEKQPQAQTYGLWVTVGGLILAAGAAIRFIQVNKTLKKQ